jgi:hypothetical protein
VDWDWPLLISIGAALIALGSFVIAVRADRRAERAERRAQRGWPVVHPRGGGSGGSPGNYVYERYGVRNAGQGAISELMLWVDDAQGNQVSYPIARLATLMPGEPEIVMPFPRRGQRLNH